MSVTLDYAVCLRKYHKLHKSQVLPVANLFRKYGTLCSRNIPKTNFFHKLNVSRPRLPGVRLENTYKNTGSRRYCFNRIQRAIFPAEYQCPLGTGGGGVT
jgi:hypothetical protein